MRNKLLNAVAAGAVGMIAYRQDQPANVLTSYTLGTPPLTNGAPAVSVTGNVANQLLALMSSPTPPIVHLNIGVVRQHVISQNIFAETPGGNPNNIVMAGAHLDSVEAGPGIVDNGSGAAALIEIAIKMAKVKPVNKVRFAWWMGEELGLVGSTFYVNSLNAAEIAKIAVYLYVLAYTHFPGVLLQPLGHLSKPCQAIIYGWISQ